MGVVLWFWFYYFIEHINNTIADIQGKCALQRNPRASRSSLKQHQKTVNPPERQ